MSHLQKPIVISNYIFQTLVQHTRGTKHNKDNKLQGLELLEPYKIS